MKRLRLFLIAGLLTPCLLVAGRASAEEVVQVFILAGQSNMEGHGNVALTEQAVDRMTKQQTFERDKNGYLEYLAKQSRDTEKFKHLLDDDGHWIQRDDGLYYRQMINEVDDALNNLPSLFPEYQKTDRYQIAGFVWFQGWNDGQSVELASEYEENLIHLVQDVRQKYGPIPVVIGSSGFGKHAPSPSDGWVNRLRLHVEPAQIAAAARLDNVKCFETGDCLIPHPDRTSNSGIHHWFNSAETYFLIGEGLGKTMKTLLD